MLLVYFSVNCTVNSTIRAVTALTLRFSQFYESSSASVWSQTWRQQLVAQRLAVASGEPSEDVVEVDESFLLLGLQCQILLTNTRKNICNSFMELRRRHRDTREENYKTTVVLVCRDTDYLREPRYDLSWHGPKLHVNELVYSMILLTFMQVYDYPKSG